MAKLEQNKNAEINSLKTQIEELGSQPPVDISKYE